MYNEGKQLKQIINNILTKNKPITEIYPYITQKLMEYIISKKQQNANDALFDIILDFCIKFDIPPELVGDAVSSDVYLKSIIEKDSEHHNIIKKQTQEQEDW